MKFSLRPTLLVSWLVTLAFAGLPISASATTPGDLFVTNLATNTVDVYAPDGTKSIFASGFVSPQGLAFDRDHNLYVADSGSGTIYKYDPMGNQTTFHSGLVEPIGLAVDGKVLLAAEHGLNRILAIPLLGGEAKVFASGSESVTPSQRPKMFAITLMATPFMAFQRIRATPGDCSTWSQWRLSSPPPSRRCTRL